MAVCLQLGIQQLSIDSHFKPPTLRRHECDRFDHVLIVFQQLICQAHGPTGIVSDRAVNDFDFQHYHSSGIQKLASGVLNSKLLNSKIDFEIISLSQLLQKRLHRFIRRFGFDLLRRTHLPHHTIDDYRDTMAKLCCLIQIMRDKDCHALILCQQGG